MIRLISKAALAAVAVVGLYAATPGLPLPEACAAPSPSCGGDLRECLRASADMRQTTFGGRYVTADDVARCAEAFRSCTSGGASRGGNQALPTSRPRGDDGKTGLPQRFGITINESPPLIKSDCAASGDAVKCTVRWEPLPEGFDSARGEFSGKLSGLTLTGTYTERTETSDTTGCRASTESANIVTYTFTPDGAVMLSWGPYEMQGTTDCPSGVSGSKSTPLPGGSATGTWSPTG